MLGLCSFLGLGNTLQTHHYLAVITWDWKGPVVLWLVSIFSDSSSLLPLLAGPPRQQLMNVHCPCCLPCPQTHERQEEGSLVRGLGHSWIRGPRIVSSISWAFTSASGKIILLSPVLNILFGEIFLVHIKFSRKTTVLTCIQQLTSSGFISQTPMSVSVVHRFWNEFLMTAHGIHFHYAKPVYACPSVITNATTP